MLSLERAAIPVLCSSPLPLWRGQNAILRSGFPGLVSQGWRTPSLRGFCKEPRLAPSCECSSAVLGSNLVLLGQVAQTTPEPVLL